MPSKLTLLLGDAGSGKTERLLSEYRAALSSARARRRPGTVLWIAPTHRAQQGLIERLLDDSGPVQLAPHVLTFDGFAEQILIAAGRPSTLIAPVMKRLLLRRIVADLSQRGQLTNFATVTHTSGFLDVISAFISELKREEIWPDEFLEACQRQKRRRNKRDRELGLIYEKYQQHLSKQNWYDVEGRFWLARTALADGVRGPYAASELLVVDGFADFTATQHEILGHLMAWIPRTVISLPHEKPLTRPELFDKPHSTVGRIRQHVPPGTSVQTQYLNADRSSWPNGMCVVASSLFANPRAVTRSDDSQGLEIVAATGPLGEVQAIAMRIKRLLLAGTAPSRIVVAVRSVLETGPVWQDYFSQAGIPAWCDAGSPLISSSIVKALFSVLQLEAEDWPFARLVQVVGSNYFQPGWPELTQGLGVRSISAALRRLKLHSGRDLILRVLGRISSGLAFEDPESFENRRDSKLALAALSKSAHTILKRFSSITERLRQKRPLAEWSDVIASLGRDLGWHQVGQSIHESALPQTRTADATIAVRDRQDWDLLQRILRTAGETDRRLVLSAETKSVKQRKMDLDEFLVEFRDLLSGERIKPVPDPGGCVRILDVEQARHLDVPHLFVVGLSESSFPLNRGDDCLFGEAERKEFALRGLPLQHREQFQRDEMFLFYSVVTRARKQLTLSYPAVNSKGQPVFASPYLVALRSLFNESALPIHHEGQLDPVPESDRALTDADLRLLAISEARSGSPGLFARLGQRDNWAQTGSNVLAAIDVNAHRFHERGFTGYEGRLSMEQNLSALRQRFGTRHQFSATELEAYAECPYRHWVTSVLNINELLTPEIGTDYLARGNLIHEVLAQMLREGLDKPAEQLAARFQALIDEHLAVRIHETELQRALTRIERRLLSQWGEAFALQQTEYFRQLQEAWTGGVGSLPPEIPFGRLPGEPDPSEVAGNPLVFGTGAETVHVRGRIDRVDTGFVQGRRVFNVIDYKTGRPPKASAEDLTVGQSLQLALYALAVRRLNLAGNDSSPYQLGYWSLKATGFKRAYQKSSKSMVPIVPELADSLEQALDDVIPRLARGIREGKFLVENSDENCTGYCPLKTTCRVNQVRNVALTQYKFGDIFGRPGPSDVENVDQPEQSESES